MWRNSYVGSNHDVCLPSSVAFTKMNNNIKYDGDNSNVEKVVQ